MDIVYQMQSWEEIGPHEPTQAGSNNTTGMKNELYFICITEY